LQPDEAGGGGELVPPPPAKIDLRDAHAIRRELGSVYRAMRSGQIPTQDGTRLAYVLDLLRRAVETSDLQNRIELIERQFEVETHARQH
jgi:hypothetical protein